MMKLKDKIIGMRNDGKSYKEISEILHCSKGTISYHCQKMKNNNDLQLINTENKNINQIKKTPKLDFGSIITENIIKEVILYRNQGLNYDEIKIKTNLSLDKIKKICRYKNINNQTKYQKPTSDEIKEMTEYYYKIRNLKKVAEKFGWCDRTLRKYIEPIKKNEGLTPEEYKIKRKKDKSNNVVNWRKDKKRKLVEYKGGCCQICGYNKCASALSFHHQDPNEKDFAISSKSYSYERLKKEVDKCILVCSNCHIEIHDKK